MKLIIVFWEKDNVLIIKDGTKGKNPFHLNKNINRLQVNIRCEQHYLFSFAQLSFSETVRLNTRFSGVES